VQQDILDAINEFLRAKDKEPVTVTDRLHSSGILSSIEMFELILDFEQRGWRVPRGKDLSLPIEKIDLVSHLCESVQRR